ncbi:PLD nuclease N-terminal domain-containing protein [Nocardiopsis xinjiangensis]|uniref:PLD nuclease N-terminal domain-containing protein n=1 Tax=Nocardiopsis xinjiangensis TaxID=124285 RepID=UPI000349DEBA|nr:PLD nuclease N-terminal domain-containing protein [Nocardiopsis xinjiangensis]
MITQLAEAAGEHELGWAAVLFGVVMGLLGLAVLILVIAAIISTLINPDTTAGGKLLWVILILWFPIVGAVAWFVVGRKRHLNRLLGIDKGKARHGGPPSVGNHSDNPSSQPDLGPGTGTA